MFGSYRTLIALLLCTFALAASAPALTVNEITDISPNVDVPPVPFKTYAPTYPASLRDSKQGGVVSVVVVIDENGDVPAAEVSKSTHDDFKEPALEAMRRWKFKPAMLAGKPVKVRVTIPVRFVAS